MVEIAREAMAVRQHFLARLEIGRVVVDWLAGIDPPGAMAVQRLCPVKSETGLEAVDSSAEIDLGVTVARRHCRVKSEIGREVVDWSAEIDPPGVMVAEQIVPVKSGIDPAESAVSIARVGVRDRPINCLQARLGTVRAGAEMETQAGLIIGPAMETVPGVVLETAIALGV